MNIITRPRKGDRFLLLSASSIRPDFDIYNVERDIYRILLLVDGVNTEFITRIIRMIIFLSQVPARVVRLAFQFLNVAFPKGSRSEPIVIVETPSYGTEVTEDFSRSVPKPLLLTNG